MVKSCGAGQRRVRVLCSARQKTVGHRHDTPFDTATVFEITGSGFVSSASKFAGFSGTVNCFGQSVAGLIKQYRNLEAAAALGFSDLAGVGNGIAQFWWTRSLSLASPSAVAPFNDLSLVWAMILGFAEWGNVPTPGLLIGSAIVVASGLYILWRETVRRRRPAVRVPQRG